MDKHRLYVDEEKLKQIMEALPKNVSLEMIMAQVVQNQHTLNGTVELVAEHGRRIEKLEGDRSIPSYFRERPLRTLAIGTGLFTLFEVLANAAPELVKAVFSLLASI